MLWHDIPNLESTKKYLTDLHLNNQLPHALLFKGDDGGAGLSIALGFMQFLHCDKPAGCFPCGECRPCKQTKNLFYPEFHFVLPKFSTTAQKSETSEETDITKAFYQQFKENIFISFDDILKEVKGKNKQAFISVQDIHSIIESVSYSAIGNKYNIVCIWNPETMMPAAANKLLKTLEEPPPQTLFFLVSSKPNELLTTIISRVQQITIPLFSEKDIIDYLTEKYSAEPITAKEIAHTSNGNMNKAIHLLNNFDAYTELLNDFRNFARLSLQYNYDGIDSWIKKYESAGREALKRFLEYSLDILHYSLLHNYQLNHLIKTTQQEKDFISKFYPYIHHDSVSKLYTLFNDAYHHAGRNANIRILLNELFLKSNETLKKKTNT